MEYLQQPAAKQGKVKMKVIPWHCQQRYQSSISQISLNHTLTSAQNSRKIKTLLHNNKCLAKALEICKYELANKENAENVDVISFAGIKLKDLSENLKKMTICVDETLALLQSHTPSKHAKSFLFAPACRRDLKQRMQALSGIEKLEEENETDATSKQNLKNNKGSKKSSSKNVQGKNAATVSIFKQKSNKKCLKSVVAKLPKNVSLRDSRPQDDFQPSYLSDLSSNLDNFKKKIEEGKAEAGYKIPSKKKPPKSKSETNQFNMIPHSTNVTGKSQQKTGPRKRDRPYSIHKETTKDCSKAGRYIPCKKAKMAFTLQDGSTTSQSSDGGMLSSNGGISSSDSVMSSSGGKSYERLEGLTNFSSEAKMDKVPSGLQYDSETSNLNGAFTTVQPIESDSATYKKPTGTMYTDLKAEFSLRQPRVVLIKSDLPQTSKPLVQKKQSVLLNEMIDGPHGLSKECAPSKINTGTTSSIITKKKVHFHLEKDDDIQMLSEAPEPLKKLTVKKTQKRPLKNTQNLASVPKKQALVTFGEALEKADVMNKNTFIVTAEVHSPPDGYIPEKTQGLKSINLLNMQPIVVLTDIYKCNSQKAVMGFTYQAHSIQKEPATTVVIENEQKLLYSEDKSDDHNLNEMSNKENKIDDQNFLEERKQSRRVSSKVSSYKEMKLNAKLRRC